VDERTMTALMSLESRTLVLAVLLVEACGRSPLDDAAGPADAGPSSLPADAAPDTAETTASKVSLFQAAPGGSCQSMHLATDDQFLIWTDEGNGNVVHASLTGGIRVLIGAAEDHPYWIGTTGNAVVWTAGGHGLTPSLGTTIRMTTGASVRQVANAPGGIYGVALSADFTMYFSTGDTIQRVNLELGDTPEIVATTANGVFLEGLGLAGTKLVALDHDLGSVEILDLAQGAPAVCGLRDPMTGAPIGACRRLDSDNGSLLPNSVLTAPPLAVWADGGSLKRHDFPPPPGRDFLILGSASGAFVNALGWRGDSVFIASSSQPFDAAPGAPPARDGVIERLSLTPGATPIVLARDQVRASSIASDDTHVYWSTADCTILRAPR
jgi:hypothetical protein